MQRRGVAPRMSASAGDGLRLGAFANATSRASSAGNAAHLGLDLLTALALKLGAAEVETQAKAARQVRDLAREGSVSCAAAAKSGAVAALVALATRRGNDIAEADERLAADPEKDTRLDSPRKNESQTNVVCVWACARDAADALTALALAEKGEGKQTLAASAKTVAALLDAIARRTPSDEDDDDFRAERKENENELELSKALARRSMIRLVFALANTTSVRVALADHRDALTALARDAGSRDVPLAAAAAGVLWVAATPPETLQRSPSHSKDPNAEENTQRTKGTSSTASLGPAATAAAGDVADAIARRLLPLQAEAASTAENDADGDTFFSYSSLVRRRVALAAASVAGRDAARAAAVSRETKLMACLVRSVKNERKGEERRAAATALWKIVSGVLRRRLASGAAARVIDALVAETDLIRNLAEALISVRETKNTDGDDDDACAGALALARLASSTLGALAGCASFARRVAEEREPYEHTVSKGATETRATPLDFILAFAMDTVGTKESAWALSCARDVASAGPGIAARCAAKEGLAPALARAAAAGGDAGVFAAGLAWLCLTAAEEADDSKSGATEWSASSGSEPRRGKDEETDMASRRRSVSAFARALSCSPVPATKSGSRTEAGAFLAATLRSMTARCVTQDAEAASTSGSTLGDSTPNHARGVSFASAESFQTGPASAGGGAAPRASDHLARRYHERRRSRAASGELGFWGSQEFDVPGDGLAAGPRSAGYGARETPRSSFGTLASRFSRGSGGAASLGRNHDPWCGSRSRLGPESRRLAAAIVSATVRALQRDGDDSVVEALLRGDLPRLLVGLACDGDGDDDLGARFANPGDLALGGSSLGASVDGDDSETDGTRGRFGTMLRTIHASAAPGLGAFLRMAGLACAAETGVGRSTDRRAFDVLADPGEGLLLAAAATLASRDAAAIREVAESLADVLKSSRVGPGTEENSKTRNSNEKRNTSESQMATVAVSQPGVLDGLARAVSYGVAGASKRGAYGEAPLPGGLAPYEQTVGSKGVPGGVDELLARDSPPSPRDSLLIREDPEPGFPMITVPLPATPKGADGAKDFKRDPEVGGSNPGRTESALARLILPPPRADGDDDDDDDQSFVSVDSEPAEPARDLDAVALMRDADDVANIEPKVPSAPFRTHTNTGARVSVPTSSLGPSPSPREASSRRRAGSWIPAGVGGAGSPSPSIGLGSPRGHERAASVSGLGSRRMGARGSMAARDELWDHRMSKQWAKSRERRHVSSSLAARRAAAAAALRFTSDLVLADASGKIAARVADHAEFLHALAGALDPRLGPEKEKTDERVSSRDELLAAGARLAASLARRGERDRVVESVVFGGALLPAHTDSGPGSFASAATALVTTEPFVSASSQRAGRAERVLDALLALAVAAETNGSYEQTVSHSVAAAGCLALVATHAKVADTMAAHGKVVPQLLALTAPPHRSKTAALAADAIKNALVASPPPPGSDAAETVWSVDAVEVLVKACRRGLGGGAGVERDSFVYGQREHSAATAAAASLRLLAAVAMTAEDDASRADIADEPGVLGVIEALLNQERPEVREEKSRGLVLAGACRLAAELARTPAALTKARAEIDAKKEVGLEGASFLGGLLRALCSGTGTTVTTEHASYDASYDALSSALGDTNARVASMCALSRLAAADGEIAVALFAAPTFVSAAKRAIAAAAAASRAGGGGGGGGRGASVPAKDTAPDVYWLASHAGCALTACAEAHLRGRATADGVGPGTAFEHDSRVSAFRAAVGSRRLARDLAEVVGGGETPEESQTETREAVEARVPRVTPPASGGVAPVSAVGPAAALPPRGSAAPGTLRARRGAGALALAVGDASGPAGRQSGSVGLSTSRDVSRSSRESHRARLAASLGAARLLRVVADSGDAANAEDPSCEAGGDVFVVAEAARAFLRAMSRFGGSVPRHDGVSHNARTQTCASAVVRAVAECLRDCSAADGDAVAAVVAGDASGSAVRALSATVARINRPSPAFVSAAYHDDERSTASLVSSPRLSARHATTRTPSQSAGGPASRNSRSERDKERLGSFSSATEGDGKFPKPAAAPSRDDALAAAAALAVVVDVARRRPESVVAIARASGFVGALAGFLDQASFARAREAAGEPLLAARGERSARADNFFDVALPPPFAYPFRPPVFQSRSGSVETHEMTASTDPTTNKRSNDKETTSARFDRSGANKIDARTVAADVFAAVAAVAPPRVVAADYLPIRRAARGLASIVAGKVHASAARTAAARALWSLSLAEGDGAAAVDAAPGAVAALAGMLAETVCPYDNTLSISDASNVSASETFAQARAAAAGALGAVFSGAAASRDPRRALLCVNAAFDVEGALRGFADVARGADADGALAAAAAVAAATRVPAGAARVSANEALLSALCDAASASAHAAEALANLAAHASSAEVLASSPAASAAWLEAATRLCQGSRQPETRAASVNAARLYLRHASVPADLDARVVADFACAVAGRLSDPDELLSTRVDAAGCASAIAARVAETLGEPAFVEALVAAFRFVGDASSSSASDSASLEPPSDEISAAETRRRDAQLRQLARLAATATRNLCACRRDETQGGSRESELSADRLARAAKEAAGVWRGGGADAATAAAVAEALAFLARRAKRSGKGKEAQDGSDTSRSGLAEAAAAAAGALVAAAVAGTAKPPGAFASPGSPASLGSARSPGASGTSRALAASAVSAIAALAEAEETCVAPFLEDAARRDALATALAAGARRASSDHERELPSEERRLSLASSRALRALAGANAAWAAVVAARGFDALIDRLRYAASVGKPSETDPSALDAADVDVDVDAAAATRGKSVQIKTFSVPGRARRSAEALAASALRRCLDFGALDEYQALALAAPGAGLLEGALACIVARGDASRVSLGDSRSRAFSLIAARFALDGVSKECSFFDDDDDSDAAAAAADAKDIDIPPDTARVAAIRTLVALASTSATAARAAASAALSFSAKDTIAVDAGGSVSRPIAALAELARSVGSRDSAVDAARERYAELAVAVCEAVAVLAGASRAARRAFVREEGVVVAFQSMGLGADPAVAAAAAAAASSLSAR